MGQLQYAYPGIDVFQLPDLAEYDQKSVLGP